MKWNIYDAEGNWLGTIHGADEQEALLNAKKLMQTAARVVRRDLDGKEAS